MRERFSKVLKGVAIFCSIVMLLTMITACGNNSEESINQNSQSNKEAEAESEAGSIDKEPSGDPILIGVSTALTGSSPLDGERTKQGVELAVEEINASGGVLGRPLKALIEDDQNLPDISVNVANKLMSQDIVAQLGPQKSGGTKAVMDIAKNNGIPLLVGSSGATLTSMGNEYLFRIRASDVLAGQTAAKFAIETLGAKKIGILFNNDDYGVGAKDVIEEYLQNQNMGFVSEGHNTGDKDMTGQIIKLKEASADVVIIWSHGPECAVIARQLKELLPEAKVVACPTYTNQDFLNLVDASDIEGSYAVADFSVEKDTPEMKKYIETWKEKYDLVPELFGTTYYQGVYILADAIERAGTVDREEVRKALTETSNFKGVMTDVDANSRNELIHELTIVQMLDKTPSNPEIIRFDLED